MTSIEPQRNGSQNVGWSFRPLRPVKGRGLASHRSNRRSGLRFCQASRCP
jgi:hypothetical protein